MAGGTLPERVAQLYYSYGLFCSSYPVPAIIIALTAVLLCCSPLLNVPLPGNIPTVVTVPLHETSQHFNKQECSVNKCEPKDTDLEMEVIFNKTQNLPYIWVKDKPLFYVQQIIMKIGVSPWNSNLRMWDAFRAPIQEVFRLLEIVRNHENPETKTTLSHLCYQIEAIKRTEQTKNNYEYILPEYSCLLLSPANLWQQNMQTFSLDMNIVNTVYNYQNLQKGKVSVAEMAFGMQLRATGIKRYPLRARPRVLQYAITIFYQTADQRFISSLTKKLKETYPLHQDSSYQYSDEVMLIYYPGKFNYHELVPLLITFCGLFLYVYFSVRKIEFIKSKFGLAACAVVTIVAGLSMSMGICLYFGFSLSLQGKEIFPYLVIIVGLENVLVLTTSVTSTDSRLDVKIRVAQGLSKEGWSITKNLLTEITIFTVSFFTFVPFIQEFAIFMIVSLLSDYFIQMVFFVTTLGIDMQQMEYFQEKNNLHLNDYFNSNNALNWRTNNSYVEKNISQRITKSKSHPRLNGLSQNSPANVVAKRKSNAGTAEPRVPKRIKLFNFWARTRFFQRAFMIWMLVWISMIVYNSGIVDYFISNIDKPHRTEVKKVSEKNEPKNSAHSILYNKSEKNSLFFSPILDIPEENTVVDENDTIPLKHTLHSRPWSRLSPYHWSTILSQYNESLAGKYVAILPATLLSHRISPELAVTVRNPDERDPPPFRWQALAAALDPLDNLPEFERGERKHQPRFVKASELPIYPTTPMEILLLAILCAISVTVIAYMMVVLYRCVCSRNYAEWRSSWNEDEEYRKIIAKQPAVQLVMEAVPLVVPGHSQEIECLVTDGENIVSSCLQGNIKVWDSQNGEIITNIDRYAYFKLQKELYEKMHPNNPNNYSFEVRENSADTNITQKYEVTPQLRQGLHNHLSGLRFRSISRDVPSHLSLAETTKYEFAKAYRTLYSTDPIDDLYNCNCSESKENIDINNRNINNITTRFNIKQPNSRKCKDILNSEHCDHPDTNSSSKNKGVLHYNGSSDSRQDNNYYTESNLNWKGKAITDSPIWCMDFCNDLIILGCADGRLEFWEAGSGKLMCVWWGWGCRGASFGAGVTHVRALSGARRVCAASLTGQLTLLRLDAYNAASGAHVDWRFSTAHKRTHKRTGSTGCLQNTQGLETDVGRPITSDGEEVVCVRIAQCKPHQQPITEMHSEGERILTGGQDHVLKVFSSSDLSPLFTLHGHCGPITSCFIDHANPTIGGSGSQDGLLCVWDLHTGACLYSMQAHDGAVTSLAYTASYVVSAGSDERLCIWDRFQGHMLNSIHIGLNYMSRMLPLTHAMLLMGDRSGLAAYDLSSGDVIRRVLFGQRDGCILVRQILPLKDAIVCDYANQLRIVRFPLVSAMPDMKNE